MNTSAVNPMLATSAESALRINRPNVAGHISEAEARVFQASSAFVSACQEATVAMHALTAKLRELEKGAVAVQKPKAKIKA